MTPQLSIATPGLYEFWLFMSDGVQKLNEKTDKRGPFGDLDTAKLMAAREPHLQMVMLVMTRSTPQLVIYRLHRFNGRWFVDVNDQTLKNVRELLGIPEPQQLSV